MTAAYGTFFPERINMYIPNMEFDANVDLQNLNRWNLGTPVTADADGILDGQDVSSAGSVYFADGDFNPLYSHEVMGRYGRNVTVVASGSDTDVVTVHGFDYLGQPMRENITLSGSSPVAGKKAFARVTQIDFLDQSGVTIDVGWGNVLGLPYASVKMLAELVNKVVTGNAGTFTAAVTTNPQTATTGDPRGTYAPHATDAPNGSREYEIVCMVLEGNLHGVRHYNG